MPVMRVVSRSPSPLPLTEKISLLYKMASKEIPLELGETAPAYD